jgi:hypothetical protein
VSREVNYEVGNICPFEREVKEVVIHLGLIGYGG